MGVALLGIEDRQRDAVIADEPRGPADPLNPETLVTQIRLGWRNEESAGDIEAAKPPEVDEASIQHLKHPGLGHQQVVHVDLAELAVGNMQKCRGIASEIEQGVQFDCRRGRAKLRLGKEREAQIDDRGIERIDRLQLSAYIHHFRSLLLFKREPGRYRGLRQ